MDFSKWKNFLLSENKLIVSNSSRRAICVKKLRTAILANWARDLSSGRTPWGSTPAVKKTNSVLKK